MNIETFNNIEIAYKRNIGPYGIKNKELMEDVKRILKINNLLSDDTVIVGVPLDNPKYCNCSKLRYDVGIIIDEPKNIEGLHRRLIDNGDYIIFEIEHTTKAIEYFWNEFQITAKQLNISKTKPIIERYDYKKIKENKCEICIPLE